MNRSRNACALAAGLLTLLAAARGESTFSGPNNIRSASGQFVVAFTPNDSPFYHRPDVTTNTTILRLEPSLLAISAERFKAALWQTLGLPTDYPWSGKIFLTLHPARSTDETVLIASEPFIHNWNYRLELPDLITRNRYARAMSAVLLLELANRNVPVNGHPAIVPPWLADGLARQIAEADATQLILSAPTKKVNGLAQTRVNEVRRGLDPLAAARRVLRENPTLTFDQLCWPDAAQMNGDDGGAYLASVQLFVHELLDLKNGPAKMRAMSGQLAARQNWQTAFFTAFRDDFRSPLEVEKWWALRVVAFAARDPGPRWTTAVSRQKLDAILSVPVDVRFASNALPSHAEISLQAALRNFEPARRDEIIQTKLRDLELVQLRLAAPLAPIGDAYRNALANYLGEQKKRAFIWFRKNDPAALLKKLDDLDARRQEIETALERKALPVPTP